VYRNSHGPPQTIAAAATQMVQASLLVESQRGAWPMSTKPVMAIASNRMVMERSAPAGEID
jgi:hypothetical protein